MKRIILLTISFLMAFSIFAATEIVASPTEASASTKVSLILDKNYAIVWFSKKANTNSIDKYALSLTNPGLLQDTSGNDSGNKIYAVSNDTDDDGLFLNWNIVSSSNIDITLEMISPLAQSGTSDVSKRIGWTVSWQYTTTTDSTGSSSSITLTDSAADNATNSKPFYLKNGNQYGNGGSKQIRIATDIVWDKDKTAEYSATLKAWIKTV